MSQRGRPVPGAIFGLLLGIFLTIDLMFFGTIGLDSAMVWVIPILMLVVGGLIGFFAPLQFLRRTA